MMRMKLLTVIVFLSQFLSGNTMQAFAFQKDQMDDIVIVKVKEGHMQEVMDEVKSLIPEVKIRKEFSKLFYGFSAQIPHGKRKQLDGVKGVFRVDQNVTYEAMLGDSVPFIGTDKVRHSLDKNGRKLTGKGVKVAVIDTGIDYHHPDLYKNYKGGYDVIDQDEDPMETTKVGATLHGTHVAGIIAANGRMQGVAPEADIYAYRALGPGGQGTTEQVIEAIERAVEDGVDIINLSLGNSVNGPDWPTSEALDKAVELGVVAVTSNGNSGPNMWTVGSPGTSTRAISVGASSPPLKIPYLTSFKSDRELAIQAMNGAFPWAFQRDLKLVYVGIGKKEDFEHAAGKIALATRGVIPFTEKAKNAKEAGALGLIIFNNTAGMFVAGLEEEISLPVVTLSKEDGEWLKERVESGQDVVRTVYRHEQDVIPPFSSRGPVTHTWEVKPDLVAPGVAIDSTIPNGYLGLNGTSMSAPHVAGAAALLKQAYPDWTPAQIKAALMNTAKPLIDRNGKPYMPHEQGAGRLQVDKALNSEALVMPGALTFGKWSKVDRRDVRTATLTVENVSEYSQTFYIEPPVDAPDGLQWKVPFSFALKPKEKKTIEVTMDIDPSVLSEGIHHGEIFVKGANEDIRVPYLFFIEEPDYPRIMGFSFEHGDEPNSYRYELYLPGGAEEMTISLYEPDTFALVTLLERRENVSRGLVERELKNLGLPNGLYKAIISAKQDGEEDAISTHIFIGEKFP